VLLIALVLMVMRAWCKANEQEELLDKVGLSGSLFNYISYQEIRLQGLPGLNTLQSFMVSPILIFVLLGLSKAISFFELDQKPAQNSHDACKSAETARLQKSWIKR